MSCQFLIRKTIEAQELKQVHWKTVQFQNLQRHPRTRRAEHRTSWFESLSHLTIRLILVGIVFLKYTLVFLCSKSSED